MKTDLITTAIFHDFRTDGFTTGPLPASPEVLRARNLLREVDEASRMTPLPEAVREAVRSRTATVRDLRALLEAAKALPAREGAQEDRDRAYLEGHGLRVLPA